jgi:hypothetical protein
MEAAWVALGIWAVTAAGLFGQQQANARSMKQRQDDTNTHLMLLNGKTFDSHREIGSLIGAFNSLPCRGSVAPVDCLVLEQK